MGRKDGSHTFSFSTELRYYLDKFSIYNYIHAIYTKFMCQELTYEELCERELAKSQMIPWKKAKCFA